MNLYQNKLYMKDVYSVCNSDIPWDELNNKSVVISGATGLLGSFLTDVLLTKNASGLNCTVYVLGRNKEKSDARFSKFAGDRHYCFIPYDVNLPLISDQIKAADYVLHLASNTHPLLYSTDPIGTITANVFGTKYLLDFAVKQKAKRFILASSNEIYGENRGDSETFDENYCGYINSNTLRAGYPESKRCSEALCQAYSAQTGLEVVIARFTRSYGPTMQMSDSKAISQFIKKAVAGEDIVLKSAGTQYYSYLYMADSVSGMLTVMLKGKNREAYNIAHESSDIMLKDLASLIAEKCGRKVVFELPDTIEAAGYSVVTKARLNAEKLENLGWKPEYDISNGISQTIDILKELSQ